MNSRLLRWIVVALCCAIVACSRDPQSSVVSQDRLESGVLLILTLTKTTAAPTATAQQPQGQQQDTYSVGTGTGFLINDQGDFVTANHVVADSGATILIDDRAPDGADSFVEWNEIKDNLRVAKIVKTDPAKDLAVIRVEELSKGRHVHVLGATSNEALQKGTPIWTAGYPGVTTQFAGKHIRSPTRKDGNISALYAVTHEANVIQHTAAMAGGMSGGPTFDSCNRVIGVNVSVIGAAVPGPNTANLKIAQGYAHSVRGDEVVEFLRSASVPFTQDDSLCSHAASNFPLSLLTTLIVLIAALAAATGFLWRRVDAARARGSAAPATRLIRDEVSRYFRRNEKAPIAPAAVVRSPAARASPKPAPAHETPIGSNAHQTAAGVLRGAHSIASARLEILPNQTYIIGRGEGVSLLVGDARVSRRHCEISARDNRVLIRNIGSGDTLVNGQRLSSDEWRELRSGDRLQLADPDLELSFWGVEDKGRW